MTVPFLSLTFDVISNKIIPFVPEEDILLTSSVSKIWRAACIDWDWTYFHGKGLRNTSLNEECSKIFLILNSDELPTETLQKLLCTETVDLLFQKTLSRKKYHLSLMNEKELQVYKKNQIFAKKIIDLLFEKCPLIVNREYFLKQFLNFTEIKSSYWYAYLIKKNHFTNKPFSNKEIEQVLNFLSKKRMDNPNCRGLMLNILIEERRPPFESNLSKCILSTCVTILNDLEEALSKAERENKELSLMDLKYIKEGYYCQKKCMEPFYYYSSIAPIDSILTTISFIRHLWTASQASLGEKAWQTMLIATTCIIKVVVFHYLATISLFLAVIGIVLPKTAEQGRALLKRLEDRWLR
jgi:hypothetical protein